MNQRQQNAHASGPSEERFLRNLAALAEIAPAFQQAMLAFDAPQGHIVAQPGDPADINLEFDGMLLYQGSMGARAMARAQVAAYLESPARLTSVPPPRTQLVDDVTDHIRMPVDNLLASAPPISLPAPANRGATLIMFGVGLGEQISLLFERVEFRHLALIEPFAELFWHSLWLQDWVSWLERLGARGGSIGLMTGDDAAAIGRDLRDYLAGSPFGTLHGSYLFRHYDSVPLEQCREQVAQEFQSLAFRTRGFFEDQLKMLVNATQNLGTGRNRLLINGQQPAQTIPAIIIGAGPSLDKSMPDLIRLQGKAVLFSAGTTLGSLLRHGVVPDFQCEIENTTHTFDSVQQAAGIMDLASVRLIGSATVDSRLPALFGDALLYIREGQISSLLYGNAERTIHGTAPNCLSLAIRMAVELGFREIYLFGTDLGSRNPDQHHVSDSPWLTNPDWRTLHEGRNDPLVHVFPANFGGKAYTSRLLNDFRRAAEDLIAASQETRFFNCSDGLRIAGAISRLPSQVRLKAENTAHADAVARVVAAAHPIDGIVQPTRLQALRLDYRRWTDRLLDKIVRWRADGGDLVALHDLLPSADDDDLPAAFAQGSLLTMFQYAFYNAHLQHCDKDPDYLDLVAAAFVAAAEEMDRQVADTIAYATGVEGK